MGLYSVYWCNTFPVLTFVWKYGCIHYVIPKLCWIWCVLMNVYVSYGISYVHSVCDLVWILMDICGKDLFNYKMGSPIWTLCKVLIFFWYRPNCDNFWCRQLYEILSKDVNYFWSWNIEIK
jgi:hypothetical protein